MFNRFLRFVARPGSREIKPGPFDIEIRGADGFVATIRGALDLIERDCPDYYQVVVSHVAAIESDGDGSGRHHEEPPRVVLDSSVGYGRDLPPRSRLVWYAGAIIRQAWHSRLYREHRLESPGAPWPADEPSVADREDVCLRVQHDALLRMGAPQWMLDYVASRMGRQGAAVRG